MHVLIRRWHSLGKALHSCFPTPANQAEKLRFLVGVETAKEEFLEITRQLASEAERGGLDSTPLWDLAGNIDGAPMELWDRCWSLVKRFESRLSSTPATAGADSAGGDGPWSKPDSKKRWAKKYGVHPTTLNRWIGKGKIHVRELSNKTIQILECDLPPGV